MIQIEGEAYLLAAEAARELKISRVKFYNDVLHLLEPCQVGVLKRPHYKRSDLLKINRVQPVRKKAS
jgi:hypothetical protein